MSFARVLVMVAILGFRVRNCIRVAESQNNRGICYGLLGDNLPPPAQVIDMFHKHGIANIRIFDPNPDVMRALSGSSVLLTVGVKNQDLQSIAGSIDAARQWFANNIEAYSGVIVYYIVVGNEVIPGEQGQYVLPAMENLQSIIAASSRPGIGVTTSVDMNVLATSYPPSSGAFTDASRGIMTGILNNLASHKRPLFLNAYPYFAYASDPVNVNLDYCMFTSLQPVVRDQGLDYYYILDAMIDAVHAAAEKVGVPNVNIDISETGWPSDGNGNFTTPELAMTYNRNFWSRLANDAIGGTPRRPNYQYGGKIFAMFNENQKPAGVEQHWGLFNPDGTQVYPFQFS